MLMYAAGFIAAAVIANSTRFRHDKCHLLPVRLVAYVLSEPLLRRRPRTALRLNSLELIQSRCILHCSCVGEDVQGLLQATNV